MAIFCSSVNEKDEIYYGLAGGTSFPLFLAPLACVHDSPSPLPFLVLAMQAKNNLVVGYWLTVVTQMLNVTLVKLVIVSLMFE